MSIFRNYFLVLVLVLLALNADAQVAGDEYQAFKYRYVGPTRGGRVTTVTGVNDNPAVFYMGATGGGVWKTTDYGVSWNNVSDGFFETASIGAIRVVQSNPDIIYVGTGSDGLRSNVITGKGVYKSEDAGATWSHAGLREVGQIGAVEIHPENPDVVFVAAIGQAFQANSERGVYRTTDGGSSWEKVLYDSDSIGAVDLEFAPDNPDIVYASLWRAQRKPWTIISGGYQAGGIYKSTDGGDSWTKKTKGLPQGLIGKIDLAVSAADPNRLYAVVEAPSKEGGLYRSDDRGESFRQISDRKELVNRPFYYTNLDANPKDADMLVSNANPGLITRDGGETWTKLNPPHGDNHDIWINPNDTAVWIQSNDGGANVSTNGGRTWSRQDIQPTAELYQVEVDDQYPYWLYAGQQDNSTISVPSLPFNQYQAGGYNGYWRAVGGCETGPAVPKPGDSDIVYSNCKGRFGVYNKRTGEEKQYYVGATNIYGHDPRDLKFRFQRVAPIHVSVHNPDVVYHTSQYVHKTTNDGQSWDIISPDLTAFETDKQVISGAPITRDVTGEEYYSTIYALRESPLKEGLIWVGANDGPVHVTQDGGGSWSDVTPEMPGGGRVDCVEPSPHSESRAYVSVLRYQLGDWKPYIFKTEDYGQSWELLTDGNGIPDDFPVRVVREDPVREGYLYAGTEFGLYLSRDGGSTWEPFQQNLPITPVTDIKVFRNDLVVSTMGRGFWIMDNVSSLHQWEEKGDKTAFLFKPRNEIRYRYGSRNSENSGVEYPEPGVLIDYYLAEVPAGEIALEIADTKGRIIARFTSEGNAETEREQDMATGFTSQVSRTGLTVNPGSNRFRWDMRHSGAWHNDSKKAFTNGPMVAPGDYRVKLMVGSAQFEQSFTLITNPVILENGLTLEDLKEQEELALKVNQMLDEARRMEDELKKMGDLKGKKASIRDEIEAAISTPEGIYMQPMLIDQSRYLLNMLNQADQKPGKDAHMRYGELNTQFGVIKKKFNSIK